MTARTDRPGPETLGHEPATRWTQLDAELRMLCRGLSRPTGWSPEAVTTFVRLPGDAEYRQAIGTLCRRLATEYRLDQTVRRQGGDWCVRFAWPIVAGAVVGERPAPRAASPGRGLRAAIARAFAAARRLSATYPRRRADAV